MKKEKKTPTVGHHKKWIPARENKNIQTQNSKHHWNVESEDGRAQRGFRSCPGKVCCYRQKEEKKWMFAVSSKTEYLKDLLEAG